MLNLLSFVFGLAEPRALPDVRLITVAAAPILTTKSVAPVIEAPSALVLDLGSGKILYEKNIHDRVAVASLTKLMTALVVRENFELNEVVTVSRLAASQEPAKIWLNAGEQITVGNLLKGLLIASGNDVAVALAEHFPGGSEKFVARMNQKARALNLKNTHFANPVGFDDPGNFSSAYDLSLLARLALRDEVLKTIFATQNGEAADVSGRNVHQLTSTNRLFGSYLDIRGLKTGSTELAGECLAAIAKKNGRETLALVLNSPNRFQEAKVLLEWAESRSN